MQTLFDLYGTIPYRIDKSEMALALSACGHRGLTIAGPESLCYFTKVDGEIEGWVLARDTNPHPIPYLYMLQYPGASDRRWVTSDARFTFGLSPLTKLLRMVIYAMDDDSTVDVSISCPTVDIANHRLGSVNYPLFSLTPDHGSSPLNTAPSEIHHALLTKVGASTSVCALIWLPVIGGLNADSFKFCGYPGPALVIGHDCRPMYPGKVDPSIAIPASFAGVAWDQGTYDGAGSWTSTVVLSAGTWTFHPIGTLDQDELHNALATRANVGIQGTVGFFDHPNILYKGNRYTLPFMYPGTALYSNLTSKNF